MDETERRFHRAMVGIYETAKRELGYNATRFLQNLEECPVSSYCVLGRSELGLPSLPRTEAVLVRPAGRLAVNAIRWGVSAPTAMGGGPGRDIFGGLYGHTGAQPPR
jgi:hypothetical protein